MNDRKDSISIYSDDRLWFIARNDYISSCVRRMGKNIPLIVYYTKMDRALYTCNKLYLYPNYSNYHHSTHTSLYRFGPPKILQAKSKERNP